MASFLGFLLLTSKGNQPEESRETVFARSILSWGACSNRVFPGEEKGVGSRLASVG